MRMAENGFGVVSAPYLLAHNSVDAGRLVQVLPEWEMPATRFWAVFPGGRLMPARTRAFIDALVTAVESQSEPWN
jgi:DNA-binding transcriptional LysR family regulator